MKAMKVRYKQLSFIATRAGILCRLYAYGNAFSFGWPSVWIYNNIFPGRVLNADFNFPTFWIIMVMSPSIVAEIFARISFKKHDHYLEQSKELEPKDSPIW